MVTPETVERMCRVLSAHDWLPLGWDATGSRHCSCCNQRTHYGDGDGGESVRAEVRRMLELALGDTPLDC